MPCTHCQGTPVWDSYEPIEAQDANSLDHHTLLSHVLGVKVIAEE